MRKTCSIFLCILMATLTAGCDPYKEGMELLEQGKYEAAAEFFYQAVKNNPEDPRAHHQLGYSYTRLKMYEEAIKQYKKALEIKPDYFEARLNLGTVCLKARKKQQAVDELKKAVQQNPDSETAHINLAWAYYYNFNLEEAEEHRSKAVKLSGGERQYKDLKQWLDEQRNYLEKRKEREKQAKENEESEGPGAVAGSTVTDSP